MRLSAEEDLFTVTADTGFLGICPEEGPRVEQCRFYVKNRGERFVVYLLALVEVQCTLLSNPIIASYSVQCSPIP